MIAVLAILTCGLIGGGIASCLFGAPMAGALSLLAGMSLLYILNISE